MTQQRETNVVIANSGVAFGTSGARGLVSDFTPEVCAAFAHAFITVMKETFEFTQIAIAIDNRPSSYDMAMACAQAAQQTGIETLYYGVVPTPALAYLAMQKSIPCIMVTGSHIPFDRNGLKFYRPDGEISKQDEQDILNSNATFELSEDLPKLEASNEAANGYIQRYISLFQNKPLAGKKIGIYEHSSAGRDLYQAIFTELGAEVTSLERTDTFVPIDTEAVSEEDCRKAKDWSAQYKFDAIFSTDGDGDRPLIADENGDWLRGDILGLLCADALGVDALAVPVSCNTAIEKSERFKAVARTKIGSPYVIAKFDELSEEYKTVAGFEANGGFLLASDIQMNGEQLKALPTRDAVLPAVVLLTASAKSSVSTLVNELPQRFTASDRIKDFPTERSQALLAKGKDNPNALLITLGYQDDDLASVDTTDGLRMTLVNSDVIHLRPSGNAPELRCYAEAPSNQQAHSYVNQVLKSITLL